MNTKKSVEAAAQTVELTTTRFKRAAIRNAVLEVRETGGLRVYADGARRVEKRKTKITEEEAATLRSEGIPHDPELVRAVCFFSPEEIQAMRADRWLGCIGLEGDQTLALGRAARLGVQIYLKLVASGKVRWP